MLRNTSLVVASLVLICSLVSTANAADGAATQQATKAANTWLRLVDEGKYHESWDQASSLFRNAVSREQWEQKVAAGRKPMGRLISRKLKLARYATSLPGAPDGQYVVIQYESSFDNKKSAIETVTPMLDKDGQWHVAGYYIK